MDLHLAQRAGVSPPQTVLAKPEEDCIEVTKKESISNIYNRIQEELRNQYSVGYARGNNRRHIVLRAKDRRLTVQAPQGCFPVAPAPPESPRE